ncbi:MAG: ATP-binding protein [Candidatus Aquirickettsiella sp.]
MIPTNIEHIANALGKIFPVNLFLVSENGRIRWANEHMLKSSKVSELKAIRGKYVSIFGEAEWLHTKKVVESKKEEIIYENIQGKNFVTIKVPYTQGGFRGVIGLSIDVTAIKKAEIAKQDFLMNMAHDLRTPLSGIIGLSNIQAKEGTKTEDRQYGQWIEGAGEQLLELLNSVLEVTAADHQIDHVKNESINLQQFSEELQALMQPSILAKKLEFQIKLANNLPIIISDRIKLKRLVLNLLSNAVKFTKQGMICLEIKQLTLDNERVKIDMFISDTGIGIAMDDLDKIFDRFYRAHPSYLAEYTGYGIGLYLVKKTINLLGGEIKVSSEEGKGSCFVLEFIFPLDEVNVEQTVCSTLQSSSLKSHPEVGKHSVLVAEDNTLVLHVVKNLLVNLGYDVTTVTDGNAALNALQTQYFHWALLDIGLPNLVGTEVAKRYRQWEKEHNKPRIPLFVLTAHGIDEVKEKCEEAGIDYILNKPFTNKDVQIIKLFMENKK